MSVPAEIMDLYSQYDFIPDEIYRGWAEAGFPIGASLEWLMVPQGLANAYLTALGTDASAHMGAISSVAISEQEDIIRAPNILGEPLTPVLRGKLRQVLLCCRIVVGWCGRRLSLHQHQPLIPRPSRRRSLFRRRRRRKIQTP